jgi:predicted RNase H-like nuclease (RuvC/YqgF family)
MSVHESQSGDLSHNRHRPSSIDLSLELEHQLNDDSLPPPPQSATGSRPQSLDPHILASIIMQLRHSLSEVTKERDQLRHRLSEAQSQESHLKATVQQLSSECSRSQDELESSRQKIRDDQNAITMLRAKVEESRCVFIFPCLAFCLSCS